MSTQAISWRELLAFSPAGQQHIIEFVQKAKQERGANWLPEIRREFPMFSWIVELVCNCTADQAFAELQAAFPNYPLAIAKPQLVTLHARLRQEIEKPRG